MDNIAVLILLVLLLIVVVIAIIIYYFMDLARRRAQKKPKEAYLACLSYLKQDPNNPDLRERTLEWGRAYSNLMRDSHGRTIFDEVALMNDINAACARATVGRNDVGMVKVTNPTAVSGQSVAQEIEKLGSLLIAGVITGEEFERGKTLFLGAPPDKAATAVELLQNLDKLRNQGVISPAEFNMKKWEILSKLTPGK